MTSVRVQENVKLSGRNYLSARKYDNILEAYKELVGRSRRCFVEAKVHGLPSVETDNDTYIRIVAGRSTRTFTLVMKRGSDPVSFGHLIRRTQNDA